MQKTKLPREHLSDAKKAELFTGHMALAQKLAGHFARRFPKIAYGDFVDEAQSAMALTIADWEHPAHGYNPTRCNRTSFLYRRIFFGLLTFSTKKQPRERVGLAGDGETVPQYIAPTPWFERFIATLGSDAKIVVETLLFAPGELVDDIVPQRPLRTQAALVGHLVGAGWTEDRVANAWNEVLNGLSN